MSSHRQCHDRSQRFGILWLAVLAATTMSLPVQALSIEQATHYRRPPPTVPPLTPMLVSEHR